MLIHNNTGHNRSVLDSRRCTEFGSPNAKKTFLPARLRLAASIIRYFHLHRPSNSPFSPFIYARTRSLAKSKTEVLCCFRLHSPVYSAAVNSSGVFRRIIISSQSLICDIGSLFLYSPSGLMMERMFHLVYKVAKIFLTHLDAPRSRCKGSYSNDLISKLKVE